MGEQLLTIEQIARKLASSHMTVRRHLPELKAKGLEQVRFSTRTLRFRESSLDKMIRRAAERGERLF